MGADPGLDYTKSFSKRRIYCHMPTPEGDFWTKAFEVDDYGMTFGMLKRQFLQECRSEVTKSLKSYTLPK